MHYWGEEDFDWDGLYDTERKIYEALKKSTGCRLVSKEKYGTIRYEFILPPGCAIWCRNKVQLWWSQCWLTQKWTIWAWRRLFKIVQKEIEKNPHLEDELMEDLASNEWLVGKEIHDKYWTTISS